MGVQVIPFREELLPQAGTLLARRHCSDRVSLPELPARYEDLASSQQAVQTSLTRPHASGFAAVAGDQLVAYLIGDMVIDNLWGRSAWVRSAGCAYDPAVGVEIVRDLYAALGERWVRYGIFTHYALIPVSDPALIQAWFSLSFGSEQIHALADLPALKPEKPAMPPGIEIRKAGAEDRGHLAAMSDVIWKTQVKAPVWGVMFPETVHQTSEDWAGLPDEAEVTVWLAWMDQKVVGIQGYWPAEAALGASNDNLHIPESCVHMSVAGTREEARGRGISTLLTQHGLAEAYEQGYQVCDTDWRSTNLLASRFWPRQGFRPVTYRLVRRIDARIAWADGNVQG